MTLQRASELPYEELIRSNCQYYLGVTKSSIRLITQLGQDGTWHGHVLKTARDGRRKGVAVLTAKGINPREVLRKLHEESAKEVDAHVAEYGIARQRRGWLDGDSDYEDDDEDENDDLGSEASESDEDKGYDDGEPARFARHAGFMTAGNMSLLAPSRADPHLSTVGTSHCTFHGAESDTYTVPARHGCGHQPMRHIVPPYNNGSSLPPLCRQQPGAMNGATRQAHQTGTRTALPPWVSLTATSPATHPRTPRGVQFVPSNSLAAWDTRPPSPPAPDTTTSTSNVPKPVLINISWVDRCTFSLVEALPLLRKPIVDAALQAAQGRCEGGPEPRLVGVLKRVRLGRCESDIKCRIDNLGPLVRQMGDSVTAGEVMPSFDVQIRTGPPPQ